MSQMIIYKYNNWFLGLIAHNYLDVGQPSWPKGLGCCRGHPFKHALNQVMSFVPHQLLYCIIYIYIIYLWLYIYAQYMRIYIWANYSDVTRPHLKFDLDTELSSWCASELWGCWFDVFHCQCSSPVPASFFLPLRWKKILPQCRRLLFLLALPHPIRRRKNSYRSAVGWLPPSLPAPHPGEVKIPTAVP